MPHHDVSFAFALASCQYPSGLIDKGLAYASYGRLLKRVKSRTADSPRLVLLVGDQIYADARAGLLDPGRLDARFALPYDALFAIDAVASVLAKVPLAMMLDDHELQDNWEPRVSADWETIRDLGIQAYWDHQRGGLPPGHLPRELWFVQSVGAFEVFVADTRTDREHRTARNCCQARLVSKAQMAALKAFMRGKPQDGQLIFLAMPALFLPRKVWSLNGGTDCLKSDSWDGYPASFHDLLSTIAEEQIHGVVFLSGDEHMACVAKATVTTGGKPPVDILSIHSPALYAPYPFANANPHDFADNESFDFYFNEKSYRVAVESRVLPETGDGFVNLTYTAGTQPMLVGEIDGTKGVQGFEANWSRAEGSPKLALNYREFVPSNRSVVSPVTANP